MTADVVHRLNTALADRYRIERELGAGGMATVYLAEDLKHNRQVAIKVLRPELAAALGPDRFMQEIQIAARLQHPHILGVHDSGQADGFLYYVMPYVEGESLRERLTRRGELPINEAVRLLSEIADALAHAHSRGVVHRDIKPENVMISGRHALVMDFGVAKAVSAATGLNALTTVGVALGTPAYMAPEQASADPHLDHRVDIYALGVVGYELLAGRPPFSGASPQQVLAAHVTQAPEPVTAHRPTITPALATVIMKALAKRPADRWQSAEEMLAQLEPLATPSGGMTPMGTAPITGVSPRKPRPRLLAGAIGLIVVAAVIGVALARRGTAIITFGPAIQISAESPGLKMQPAISADGEWVAYVDGTTLHGKIYVRRVGGGRPISLTDDTISADVEQQPRFSPDGKKILFLARGGAFVAPAQGGTVEPLVPGPDVVDALWSPSGDQIAFVRDTSLFVRDVSGGEPRLVAHYRSLYGCSWSRDGALLACTEGQNNYRIPNVGFGNHSPSAIVTIPVRGGTPVLVTDSTGFAIYPSWGPDRLYFVSDQNHQRDVFTLLISSDGHGRGQPVQVTSGLGALAIGVTPDGKHLIYTKYSSRANIWSVPINPARVASVADAIRVTSGDQTIEAMRVSRDGRWLVFDSDLPGTPNIYVVPVAGGVQDRLTHDSVQDFAPDLSPNDSEVAFHSYRTGTRDVFVLRRDGRPDQQVTSTQAQESFAVWSPDGNALTFLDQRSPTAAYIVKRMPDGSWGKPVKRLAALFLPDWSPDGRFLVGVTDGSVVTVPVDSGPAKVVYGRRPTGDAPVAIKALWNPDGKTILFKSRQADTASFWSIPATGGTPHVLARLTDPYRLSLRGDFSADRTHLYFTLDDRQSDLWVVDLKRR